MRMGVPRVRASISSVAVAYTFPAFANAAHCASASHGAFYFLLLIMYLFVFSFFHCLSSIIIPLLLVHPLNGGASCTRCCVLLSLSRISWQTSLPPLLLLLICQYCSFFKCFCWFIFIFYLTFFYFFFIFLVFFRIYIFVYQFPLLPLIQLLLPSYEQHEEQA